MTEAWTLHEILKSWGAHPRLRLARCNTGAAKLKGRWVKFGVPGTADVVGIIAPTGRMIMIEVKSATGVQSSAQKVMQRVVTAMGGLYILARSLAEVDAVLSPLIGPR